MRALFAPAAIAAALALTSGTATAAPPGEAGFDFRAGGFFPAGGSDFWDEIEQDFTIDHSDLNGLAGSFGYVSSINNWVEFDIAADVYAAEDRSSDRDFTDQNGNPIFHDSRLLIVPVTASVRVLPAGRYARRGAKGDHYVRRPVPYIGGGIGLDYWAFEEEGDFVFVDLSAPSGFTVAYDRRKDTGVEFESHVKLGIEFPVAPSWNLTLEARRSWAGATLDEGFPSQSLTVPAKQDLDLGGVSVYFGASVRF